MYRSSGIFESPEQLCYQARMQYVKGHVETYDPEWHLLGRSREHRKEPRQHVWTLEKPAHMRPRHPSMRAPRMNRPIAATS